MASNRIRLRARMLETMQDFIESNKLGGKIARQKLGKTPNSIVVEKISSANKLGRTGILLLQVKFNSNEGPFEGSLAIKDFKTVNEVQRMVQLNEWLQQRIQSNPRVSIPQIFSAGGSSIVYEGIEGLSYEESKQDVEVKLRATANAVATFHSAFTNPINQYRYPGLLRKTVSELPISNDRKHKLLSYGMAFYSYYDKSQSGVISYGDFHPGNIMISPNGETSYLIDPEFIESEVGADRFEDISNFFIFDAYMEFLNNGTLSQTFEKITSFMASYNNLLNHYDTNLHAIYNGTQWLALIFHFGLMSLLKGSVAVQSMKSNLFDERDVINSAEDSSIEEIIQSYRLCREIWFMGVQYLPKYAIPRSLLNNPIQDGFLITWPTIYNVLIDLLKHDSLFGLLFNFPHKKDEIMIEEAVELFKIKDKKALQNNIKDLNEAVGFEAIQLNKKDIRINSNWMNLLDVPKNIIDWQESSKKILRVWQRNPINMLITIMDSFSMLSKKDLEQQAVFDKKSIKNLLRVATEKQLIKEENENVYLNDQWKFILGFPYFLKFSYFY